MVELKESISKVKLVSERGSKELLTVVRKRVKKLLTVRTN